MKTIITTLLLLMTLSIQADLKDWERKDKILWYSYLTLNVIDTGQTFDLIDKQRDMDYIHRKNLIETNPILGKNPGKKELLVLKTFTTIAAYYILDKNPKHRTLTLGIMNGLYVNTVYGNHEIGLRVNINF